MAKKTVRDAEFLESKEVTGAITGIKTKISVFELKCRCGKIFYPKFNHNDDLWFDCIATPGVRKSKKKEIDRYYDYLVCSKDCSIGGIKKGDKRHIFNVCKTVGCEELISVQGRHGTDKKFPAHTKYCIKCRPKGHEISHKSILRQQKKIKKLSQEEECAQKEFEKSFFQGGSPGLKSQK